MSRQDDKGNKIEYLIDFVTFDLAGKSGISLIDEQKLRLVFSLIGDTVLRDVATQISNGEVTPDIHHDDFREWIKRRRVLSNISQSEAAKKVGIRPEQICRYENGTHPLADEHLNRLRKLFEAKA